MKKQLIIILIILSFIAPALHFIEHTHNYNPFTQQLEHNNNSFAVCNSFCSQYQKLDKSDYKKTFDDECQITIINKIFKNSDYSPIIKTKNKNHYTYISYFLPKNKKNNNILFIAPKNSPPIA
jgi:uncharacterized protein YxeA